MTTTASAAAGATNVMITHASFDKDTKGTAKPGDIFTITDSSDSNHTKAYQVTRVEHDADYLSGTTAPTATQLRVHFVPALQRAVSSGSTVVLMTLSLGLCLKTIYKNMI